MDSRLGPRWRWPGAARFHFAVARGCFFVLFATFSANHGLSQTPHMSGFSAHGSSAMVLEEIHSSSEMSAVLGLKTRASGADGSRTGPKYYQRHAATCGGSAGCEDAASGEHGRAK